VPALRASSLAGSALKAEDVHTRLLQHYERSRHVGLEEASSRRLGEGVSGCSAEFHDGDIFLDEEEKNFEISRYGTLILAPRISVYT
jgi:hypothetical protein